MERMKTFGIYLLIFVGFYIFSTIAAYFYIQSTYGEINGNVIENNNIKVVVEDAKATIMNGYIKGSISNTTSTEVKSKYIKIDLISKRDNKILTKYIYVDELKSGEKKDFNLSFRAADVKKFNAEVVEHAENQDKGIEVINIKELTNDRAVQWTMFIGAMTWITLFF